ncbi:MAG: PQQ-binding-like beta-propeller repeat protein [Gammaproteobacteria bacterium]|nr:PQQ-binding-like beta-propeller repeat protein [Gammaproteobacteria bacterium]
MHVFVNLARLVPALGALLLCAAPGIAASDPQALFDTHCASCHAHPETKAPPLATLQQMPLSRLMSALEFGKMQPQAAQLDPSERQAIAQWIAVADDAERDNWIGANACSNRIGPIPVDGHRNWGFGVRNTRHIEHGVAIDADNIGDLELAWSLAIPQVTDMRSQPVAAGNALFLGTQNGNLLALDQRSGCVFWQFRTLGAIRSSLNLAATSDGVATLFFADDLGTVYAVAAENGTLRWKTPVRIFQTSVVSGSLTFHEDRLLVPLSSFEVAVAGMPTYPCCRSHGLLLALDALTGKTLWTYHTTAQAAKTKLNSAGVQMWGPSGASVWSTPTVDARRGLVYIGTGENLSQPQTTTSDAVIAIDIASGEERWHFQALAGDVWNGACQLNGPNCPETPGPDWDIGASVILSTDSNGRDRLLDGQKSGELFALDPDRRGALLWRKRLSQGTANGGNSGIHWGMASDAGTVFAPVSDPDWKLPGYTPRPGIYAVRIADGSLLWEHPVTRGCDFDPADAPSAGLAEMRQSDANPRDRWPDCSYFYAHSAAAVLANGVVYAGALDGKLRALAADDGRELRVFETARAFTASNGIDGHGGAIDVTSAVIQGDHLYIVSGYSMFGQMPGNMLLAYALPPRKKPTDE